MALFTVLLYLWTILQKSIYHSLQNGDCANQYGYHYLFGSKSNRFKIPLIILVLPRHHFKGRNRVIDSKFRVSSQVLTKVAQNASKVIGLSVEQTNKIEWVLVNQSIRKSENETVDDWSVTLKQITKVESFVPFCRSKQLISSGDCHKLVSQMIIYLQKVEERN
jgi:hypothetical protein